jgi:hypothetical protein
MHEGAHKPGADTIQVEVHELWHGKEPRDVYTVAVSKGRRVVKSAQGRRAAGKQLLQDVDGDILGSREVKVAEGGQFDVAEDIGGTVGDTQIMEGVCVGPDGAEARNEVQEGACCESRTRAKNEQAFGDG